MLRFSLKQVIRPSYNPQTKEQHLSVWGDELSLGNSLSEVTNMLGYQRAVEHFEKQINEKIRAKTLNLDEVAGIQSVFDYFEAGHAIAKGASESINKYKDEPE